MKKKLTTATESFVQLDAGTDDPSLVQLSQLIALADDGAPPREFQMLAAGETRTTKGTILCDDAHATLCLGADTMPADGLLPLDYNHGMVSFMGGDSKAAGWFKLSNRNGALWATDVQYTPAAEKALREREYRYFSPALFRDEAGYVTRLVNCALTCLPATLKQRPLVASETPAPPEGNDMDLAQLCAAFGVANASQLAAKFQQLAQDGIKLSADNAALVSASQALQGQIATLTAAVAARKQADEKAERDSYLAQLSNDGKLAPAMLPWAQTQSLEQLKAYGAVAVPVVSVATKIETKATDPSAQSVELTAEDAAICSQMKIAPKDFVAMKAQLAAQANPHIVSVDGFAAATKKVEAA
jgi:phage I-like protein